MTDTYNNLPIVWVEGLHKLQQFLAVHPGLAVGIESISVDADGKVEARWASHDKTYASMQAVALAHRNMAWKRERKTGDYSWLATEGDVTLTLPHAEPVEYVYGPTAIDLEAFKISGATLVPA